VAAASFGTGKLAPGKYQVSAEIANRKGTVLAAATAELVYRERPAWLGSSAGKSERVLPPFTELVLEPGPDQGTTVSCWGRRYRFGAGPFLAGAESAGCDLLAGPLRLVGTAGGRPLALSLGPLGVGSADAARCCLSRSAEGGALGFAAETLVEYDGLVRCDWRLRARRAVDLAELAIEVPVSTACARYLYAWPQDSTDGLRLSGALTEDRALPFRALVWLGDEARGLCWFAESDRNWSLADSGRAIQVLRRDGETVLRLNLVTAPVALAKDALLDYTFGLQATPLRPVDRDGWDFRFAETPWYGKDYELLSKPLDGKPALAALAGKGVRTLLVFNAWSDIFGYYRPAGHDQEFRTLVQAAHAEGLKVVPYFSFLISELAPEHAYLRDEVTVRPLQVFTWPPKHPAIRLPQVAHVVCLKGIWQDALADGIARLIDEYGIDGVYLDSTAVPFACRNREHGCGYLAGTVPVPAEKAGRAQSPESSDRVAPVYPIFAVREALRRIYTVVKERRPEGLVDVHVYDAMTAPALAFATSYFTGEQLSRPASKLEADGLPLDRFRTEMMGRNWGLPADFMAYMLGDYRRSHAISLLHDVLIRPAGEAELNFAAPLWKLADEFGRSEARWLPYWVNADLVSVSPAGCHASLYQHPANGILAVVSNLSGAETTATVGLNLARLGVAAGGPALDGLTREGLPCQEGRIAVPLPPMAWRLVWVKPGAP
jgi:hypothetical protein